MSPYSRSAKVLIYLVTSMTVATALLLWVEHLVVPPDAQRAGAPVSKPIAEALHTNQTVQPGKWEEIVISYRERLPTSSAVALAAPSQQLPFHFIVTPSGQIRALPAWRDQQPGVSGTEPVSQTVHICVAGQADSTTLPAEQWDALVSLIRQLRAKCRLPARVVRLDPQSDAQVRPNVPPQAQRLRQMLLAADIID